jgi:hypothetical protein
MVPGPASIGGSNSRKAEISQVEGIDKGIDDANGIALVCPILQAFRQQRRLSAIDALDEPRHARLRRFTSRIIAATSFHTARVKRNVCRSQCHELAGSDMALAISGARPSVGEYE